MTTQEVANRLVALCRQQEWTAAQTELYAADAVSIEPYAQPGYPLETKGLPAIIEKGHRFTASVETMHSLTVSDPIVGGNAFAVSMSLDLTMKGQGRMQMAEVCVYNVKDGKIVSERFFV